MQGREEDIANGLTRAGGKQLQVMPDGSLTVIQEARWDSVRAVSRESEVGIGKISNRVVPQKLNNAFVPVIWGKSVLFFIKSSVPVNEKKRRFKTWKIQKRLYLAACRQQVT